MIKPEHLIHLLGKSITDPEIERLKEEPGSCEIAEFDGNFDYCFYGQGLALNFEDSILETIHLFPDGRDGYKEYSYPIPHGLRFSMKKADWRAALGKPSEAVDDDVEPSDIYKFPDHVLSVGYGKKTKTTTLLTFMTLKKFAQFDE